MGKNKHSVEQIIRFLKQAEVLATQGKKVPDSSLNYRPPTPEAIVSHAPHSATLQANHDLQHQRMN